MLSHYDYKPRLCPHSNLANKEVKNCANPEVKISRTADALIKRCVAFDDFVAVKFMMQAHSNLHFTAAAAVFCVHFK